MFQDLFFGTFVAALIIGVLTRRRLPANVKEYGLDCLTHNFGGLLGIGNSLRRYSQTPPFLSPFEDVKNAVSSKSAKGVAKHMTIAASKFAGVPGAGQISATIRGRGFYRLTGPPLPRPKAASTGYVIPKPAQAPFEDERYKRQIEKLRGTESRYERQMQRYK